MGCDLAATPLGQILKAVVWPQGLPRVRLHIGVNRGISTRKAIGLSKVNDADIALKEGNYQIL